MSWLCRASLRKAFQFGDVAFVPEPFSASYGFGDGFAAVCDTEVIALGLEKGFLGSAYGQT